jgi:hypothetical protein
LSVYLIGSVLIVLCLSLKASGASAFYPENNKSGVNPHTHLKIIFESRPIIGSEGKIRIFDSRTDFLVDVLDMSILVN